MEIDRRNLLQLAAAGAAAVSCLPVRIRALGERKIYFAARTTNTGEFRASGFSTSGYLIFDFQLPARGHSFAVHPHEPAVVNFARRPGRFAIVIDFAHGQIKHSIVPPTDRHFYGHGVYSHDGRLLYTSENDFKNERGAIGIYDAKNNYKRVGEIDSYGIGPHDIRLLSDNRTLVIANGGIHTRPDLPRVKLNLPTMAPSLCYVDRNDGKLVAEKRLNSELHQLSIRHLSVSGDDTVGVAMQYEGVVGDLVPLVALHRLEPTTGIGSRQNRLRLLKAPSEILRAMKQYCGSACIDPKSRIIAVSAPRGNLIAFWDISTGQFLTTVRAFDSSGIALADQPGEFLVTSGRGDVAVIDAISHTVSPLNANYLVTKTSRWDNHLIVTTLTD